MKKYYFFILFFAYINIHAQNVKHPKIILITMDGFRWEELFTGADLNLISDWNYTNYSNDHKSLFWRDTPEERRELLMPFLWTEVSKIGVLHGNRNAGSKVDLTNTIKFSYPGYNEILTGKADDKNINSNKFINNPNVSFLEIANNSPQYHGKVAAFTTWRGFPYILNIKRSGIPLNAGKEIAYGDNLSEKEHLMNLLQVQFVERMDAFTFNYAIEYMKRKQPDLVYIAVGETDAYAHDGRYGKYLKAANATDKSIKELWEFVQEDEYYKDNTIILVTTDHGRGNYTWTNHETDLEGSDQVWLVAFGKDVQQKGEITVSEQLYTNQIAPTILKLLDINVDEHTMPGEPLNLFKK